MRVPLLPSGPGGFCANPLRETRLSTAPANRKRASLAEREGFEPSVHVNVHTLSRRVPSAARTSLLPAVRFLSKTCVKGIYLCNIFQGVFARKNRRKRQISLYPQSEKPKNEKPDLPFVF